MLASALESHPDITCNGERPAVRAKNDLREPGKVHGAIINSIALKNNNNKVIYLTRNAKGRAESIIRLKHGTHFTEPTVLDYESPSDESISAQLKIDERYVRSVKYLDKVAPGVEHYDRITGVTLVFKF